MPQHLHIGGLIFPDIDQCDFTAPFEVLSRIPDSTFHVLCKDLKPVRDAKRLILTPEMTLADAPQLDVLLVPGGTGQHALMEDEAVLSFIRRQAAGAKLVLSVCTGALTCGAAGLLVGKQATTHWASLHLLKYFGAIPVDERVVQDENLITAAGVTSGIDASLTAVALLRGRAVAEQIQLYIQYAPEPPFDAGSPGTAPAEVVATVRAGGKSIADARLVTARRIASKLKIQVRDE